MVAGSRESNIQLAARFCPSSHRQPSLASAPRSDRPRLSAAISPNKSSGRRAPFDGLVCSLAVVVVVVVVYCVTLEAASYLGGHGASLRSWRSCRRQRAAPATTAAAHNNQRLPFGGGARPGSELPRVGVSRSAAIIIMEGERRKFNFQYCLPPKRNSPSCS